MLCEPVLGNISLVIPDNRDIFAIERIIDFTQSIFTVSQSEGQMLINVMNDDDLEQLMQIPTRRKIH